MIEGLENFEKVCCIMQNSTQGRSEAIFFISAEDEVKSGWMVLGNERGMGKLYRATDDDISYLQCCDGFHRFQSTA